MRTQQRSGFTIIEVMLFLAITGALTVGILVGSGAAINRQRYRDSVNTFKSLIQEQYSQIANVVNSEPENPSCSPSASTQGLVMNQADTQDRGTSECLVIGRFLLVKPTMVTAYNLIGQLDPGENEDALEGGDSEVLSNYFVTVQAPESHEVSWGARLVEPKTTNGAVAAILIVRSPISGSILTYIEDEAISEDVDPTDGAGLGVIIKGMMTDDHMVQKDFCVDSDGGLSVLARRQAVRINARAANQSAIEIPLEGSNVCD